MIPFVRDCTQMMSKAFLGTFLPLRMSYKYGQMVELSNQSQPNQGLRPLGTLYRNYTVWYVNPTDKTICSSPSVFNFCLNSGFLFHYVEACWLQCISVIWPSDIRNYQLSAEVEFLVLGVVETFFTSSSALPGLGRMSVKNSKSRTLALTFPALVISYMANFCWSYL